jgi:nucleoid DNA-binding protein
MADLSSYIEELLDEHDYVIVPGLGAFVSDYHPAAFGEGNTLLIPPSRVISFKPELKINDGLLAGYIAHQQKITALQAQNQLDSYTGDVLYLLDQGKEVTVGKVGTLSVRKGEIIFHPGVLSNEIADSFGLGVVEISVHPAGYMQTTEKSSEEEGGKRQFPRKWTRVLFLVTIVLVAGYFLLKHNQPASEPKLSGIPQDSAVTQNAVPRNYADSARIDSSRMETGLHDTLAANIRKGWYYTIGGSFKSEQNAGEYFDKMVRKGFHPVQLGQIGKFYLVALDSFYKAKDAFDAANRYMKLNGDTGVWVYLSR